MTSQGFVNMRSECTNGEIDSKDFDAMANGLRKVFYSGKTKSLQWRKEQLTQVCKMVEENYDLITTTVRKDHGGPKVRGLGEVGALSAAEQALENLNHWAADEKVSTPFELSPTRLGASCIRKEPKGVVLIIAPWNYPFDLCLTPLVSAIAAGNCAVVKPSEVSENSAKLIEELINKYLDTSCIKVVQGAVAETTALLKVQWDHIFFTGNGAVGRIVMRAAAEHLTPVTLELGGKSPCIIDKTAKMDVVISRVVFGKLLNAGQTCIAPDYIIIHKDRKEEFLQKFQDSLEKQYGKNLKQSGDYGKIINSRHVARIKNLVEGSKGKVIIGGVEDIDAERCHFPPTVLIPETLDEPVMKEEIFGPVLPVVVVDDTRECFNIIQHVCSRPLALYVYANDSNLINEIVSKTQSGGVGINTCIEQYVNQNLPFGGTGASGMGYSHGKAGFDEFSHKRSVLSQDNLIKRDAMLPPFPLPEFVYNVLVRVAVTGFIPRPLRGICKGILKTILAVVFLFFAKKMYYSIL